jgi:glyoxylate reductase
MKVFITREIPEVAFKLLKKNKIDFEIYKSDRPIPRRLLLQKVKNCDALISLLTDCIDEKIIGQMTKCRIIANYAVGYDNIDIDYAKKKKIIVTNTPDVLTESTADLTFALILACARRIFEGVSFLRNGLYKGWEPKLLLGMELKDKTLGILGAGRIGTAVAKRAKSFGMNVLYSDYKSNPTIEKKFNGAKVTLNNLLNNSDILSIHLPLNKKTFHFLDKGKMKKMMQNSILINTSRGEIIDERALINLLRRNKFIAVGLDVFENEPKVNPALLKYINVIVLPHLGSATNDARNSMAELAAQNVINVLNGLKPITPVY